jgi:cobalamin biosynthesis Co2+ chelatase CbiK
MATLAELKTKLAALETIQDSGVQEYNIVGSHSVKNVDYDKLSKQIANLRRRIYRFQGYTGRTTPDFSTGNSKNVKDYL